MGAFVLLLDIVHYIRNAHIRKEHMVMKIVIVGMNYQTAPIEMREKVSFSNLKLEEAYKGLKNIKEIKEAIILDTCNRTEVYAYVSKQYDADSVLDFLMSFHGLEESWRENFYQYKNKDAVDHLYRVAASLDSMVVGEDQILGQVKVAYEQAMDMEMVGKVFHTLFRYAITSAKKIKTSVMGNNPPLSVSSIAIQFLQQKLPDLKKKKVFVLGVGKMSIITIQNLVAEGVEQIFVANRTKHRTKQLQIYFPDIQVVPYEERLGVIAKCDIIISSTSAPHYIVTKEMLMPFYQGAEVYFVDLSLPRDIEPSIGELDGITIFTLDNLQRVSKENMEKRKIQGEKAEKELKIEQEKFWEWYMCQPVVPTISQLQNYYTEISNREIESLMERLGHLEEKDKKLIYTVSKSMARKLFNIPILQLKECAKNGEGQIVCKVVEDLFELPTKSEGGSH